MEQLNIYEKLAKIRKPAEVLSKNKSGYGYRYVTEDAILEKITGGMDKYGVSLIPEINQSTTVVTPYSYEKTKNTKNGQQITETVNEILVQGEMVWNWVNNENPEDRISVPWVFIGQQSDASQAFGAGLTYASRYFMLKYFNIATTEDDPDAWRTRQKEAERMEAKEEARAIIETAHEYVLAYLEKKPSDRDKVTELTKKYTKLVKKTGANYFTIDDPEVAAKFYEELTATFNYEEKKTK